jgi:hypothetical protein
VQQQKPVFEAPKESPFKDTVCEKLVPISLGAGLLLEMKAAQKI